MDGFFDAMYSTVHWAAGALGVLSVLFGAYVLVKKRMPASYLRRWGRDPVGLGVTQLGAGAALILIWLGGELDGWWWSLSVVGFATTVATLIWASVRDRRRRNTGEGWARASRP